MKGQKRWKSGEKTDHSLVQAAVLGLGRKPVGLLGCKGECEVALGSNVFCNSVCRWSMCVSGVNMCALANKHAHSSTREKNMWPRLPTVRASNQRRAAHGRAHPHAHAHSGSWSPLWLPWKLGSPALTTSSTLDNLFTLARATRWQEAGDTVDGSNPAGAEGRLGGGWGRAG